MQSRSEVSVNISGIQFIRPFYKVLQSLLPVFNLYSFIRTSSRIASVSG